MNTGKTFIGRPSLGSWAVYGLGTENESLPGYVVILDKRGGPISGQPNWSSGFMPSTYQGRCFAPLAIHPGLARPRVSRPGCSTIATGSARQTE
jgi:hypothetical protein